LEEKGKWVSKKVADNREIEGLVYLDELGEIF
jgi:hypothetical protein